MITLQQGDVVFFPAARTFWSRMIIGLQKNFRVTGQNPNGFYHVGIMVSPYSFVEMTWPKCKKTNLADDVGRPKVFMRPQCTIGQAHNAAVYALAQVGRQYGLWEYVSGFFGVQEATHICSGLVAEAYERAGYPLVKEKDLITPDELYMSTTLNSLSGAEAAA